jgi:hypothetical protein
LALEFVFTLGIVPVLKFTLEVSWHWPGPYCTSLE